MNALRDCPSRVTLSLRANAHVPTAISHDRQLRRVTGVPEGLLGVAMTFRSVVCSATDFPPVMFEYLDVDR